MRVLRIFCKPNGTSWFDYAMPDNMSVAQLEARFRSDGCLCDESGIVRYEAMLYAYTWETGVQAGKVVQLPVKPSWLTPVNNNPPDKPA